MSIFKLLTILIVIVAILLIAVIMVQEPKERVTPSNGGVAAVQRIGINQKADLLEKATWVLVGLLLLLTLLAAVFLKGTPQSTLPMSPNLAKVQAIQTNKIDSETTSNVSEDLPPEDIGMTTSNKRLKK